MPTPAQRTAVALTTAAAALVLAACGSADTPATSSSASQPTLINPVLPTGASPDDLKNCRGETNTHESKDSPQIDCVAWRQPNPATLPWPRLVELRKQIQGPEGRQRTVGASYLCGLLKTEDLKDFGPAPLRSTFGDACQVYDAPKETKDLLAVNSLKVGFRDGTVPAPDGKDIRALDGRTIAVSLYPGSAMNLWSVRMETPTDGVLLNVEFDGPAFTSGLTKPSGLEPLPPLPDNVERLLKVLIASQQK